MNGGGKYTFLPIQRYQLLTLYRRLNGRTRHHRNLLPRIETVQCPVQHIGPGKAGVFFTELRNRQAYRLTDIVRGRLRAYCPVTVHRLQTGFSFLAKCADIESFLLQTVHPVGQQFYPVGIFLFGLTRIQRRHVTGFQGSAITDGLPYLLRTL